MDVFLMPSRVEGIGLALLEAMACECCPVVTAVGGIKEVVTDATVGWAAAPNDPEGFLRGMQCVLDLGPEGRHVIGARARQRVLQHFRASEQYAKLADLIDRL
jgi:glycosyltransferase involved in cell wall biosynthesis